MTTEVKHILKEVASLKDVDTTSYSDDEMKEYRQALAGISKASAEAMAKTSTKEHNYDMVKLSEYVQHILEEAWECRAVPLGPWDEFREAQKLKRFAPTIKCCIECSKFDDEFLREYPMLSVQRRDILSAKTLQELRNAVRAMIGPLRMAREWKEYRDGFNYYTINTIEISEYETVLQKLECVEEEVKEVRRVNNEILALFEPTETLEGKDLLDAIEKFKHEHKCTDTEAVKPFNVSRTTLHRLRKEFKDD